MELLSEDPDIARSRAELEQTKARLVDISVGWNGFVFDALL